MVLGIFCHVLSSFNFFKIMKGFDIYINNKKISAVVKRGVVVICLDNGSELSVSGIDDFSFQNVRWVQQKLTLGDKITIVASEVEESSTCEEEPLDKVALLERYTELKKELTERGLLK